MRVSGLAAAFALVLGVGATPEGGGFFDSARAQPAPTFENAVLLRNDIEFTGGRVTAGASASLIEIDGEVYVLTAKHLLGSAMGVEPAVLPSRFDAELVRWSAAPNRSFYGEGDDPFSVAVTGMHRPDDNLDVDLMLLETDMSPADAAGRTLPLSDALAMEGDAVFLVGCPYAEGGACAQNLYPATVLGTMDELYVIFLFDAAPPALSGFSGAPILNADGEIVGVLGGRTTRDDGAWGAVTPEWLRAHGR